MDISGTSDPYVIVYNNGTKIAQSSRIEKTLNPDWDFTLEEQTFEVNDNLKIDIYDHDNLATDDYMGTCYFKITVEMLSDKQTHLKLKVLDQK